MYVDTIYPIWVIVFLSLLLIVLILLVFKKIRIKSRQARLKAKSPVLKSEDGRQLFVLYPLNGEGCTIGRGHRGVHISLDKLSPNPEDVAEKHARVFLDNRSGHVVIETLDGNRGVYINGRRAPRKNLLRDGWTVGIGGITLVFRDGESDTGPLV